MLLYFYFLFPNQDLTKLLCLPLPLVDLKTTLINNVLIIALYDLCLYFFLYFVLPSLLLSHLILLLLLFGLFQRYVFGSILSILSFGYGQQGCIDVDIINLWNLIIFLYNILSLRLLHFRLLLFLFCRLLLQL